MDEKLTQAQDIILEKINLICGKFGLNNIMAQLYAILYLSNKALSLDDMVQRLKISKGSASVNIRALERYGAARKIWVKGSRRDYYEAEVDIAKVIIERVKSMFHNRLSEVDEMITSSYRILNPGISNSENNGESAKVFKERLNKLRGFHNKAQSLFDLLNSQVLNNILSSSYKQDKNEGE